MFWLWPCLFQVVKVLNVKQTCQQKSHVSVKYISIGTFLGKRFSKKGLNSVSQPFWDPEAQTIKIKIKFLKCWSWFLLGSYTPVSVPFTLSLATTKVNRSQRQTWMHVCHATSHIIFEVVAYEANLLISWSNWRGRGCLLPWYKGKGK